MKTEKFNCPNKVLLVLGQRTGAIREDCFKRSHFSCPVKKKSLYELNPY